jgi:hypothetical protein
VEVAVAWLAEWLPAPEAGGLRLFSRRCRGLALRAVALLDCTSFPGRLNFCGLDFSFSFFFRFLKA